ncbi:MAG: M23 family metallopeptidase [Thermoproteota archaeon]|nr:M23 family metallopeptidase [Thermoproteota archaeon]
MSTYNKYRIPVPKDLLQRIDRTSSPAHVWYLRHAVDFLVPQTTPVLVAADGEVVFVSDDSNIGGPDPSYWTATNFITIKHPFGEYSRYDHLGYQSAKVRVGQQVQIGQQIAKVGMTGYTYTPHLHFQVFVFTGNIWTGFDTIEVEDFIS